MKIGTPELKVKPATKYFDGGYVRFATVNKELFYQTIIYDDKRSPFPFNNLTIVKDAEHLKSLLATKTRAEVLA